MRLCMKEESELRVLVYRVSTRRLLSLSEAELNFGFITRRRKVCVFVERWNERCSPLLTPGRLAGWTTTVSNKGRKFLRRTVQIIDSAQNIGGPQGIKPTRAKFYSLPRPRLYAMASLQCRMIMVSFKSPWVELAMKIVCP